MRTPRPRPVQSRARRLPGLTGPGLAMLLLVALVAASPGTAGAQANLVGQWSTLPYLMPINPIHVALMHTGKVVIAAGSENDPTQTVYRAAVWDPATGTITTQTIPWDLFCNAMGFLPDGRVLVVGGNLHYYPFLGLKTTTVFDPATEKWAQLEDMTHGRWYPSTLALDDGGTMTFGGYNETGVTNQTVEIYDVPTGWTPPTTAPFLPALYPWMHQLKNGKVLYTGATRATRLFDPVTGTWGANIATQNYAGIRTYGSSVMLPLLPETGYTQQIMIMGGDNPATATAEIINPLAATPTWQSLPPMSAPRVDMSAVILPTGKILALGGSAQHNVASTASLAADLFDPAVGTWSPAGVETYARMYHSVALLLPDATVWVAGSNPSTGVYEPHMEIYSPAYLFTKNSLGQIVRAARPSISSVPAVVGYNASFQIQTADAANIAKVVFIRPGSDTHGFNFEQRYVGLTFTPGTGTLTAVSPPDARIAPPRYYMVFLVDGNGVPSVAKFVQLSEAPSDQPPVGTITNPSANVTIAPGQSVTFAGTGTSTTSTIARYHWVFPGGTPAASTAATPGAVVFPNPGTHTASLTVVDALGVNDPSPPVVTVTVQGAASLTAAFTSPANGATVSGTVTVGMSSSAASGTFALSIDGTVVSTQSVAASTAAYTWNTTTVANGAHTLSFTVTDGTGHTATATETVTVSNGTTTGYTASFLYPAAGTTVGKTQTVGMSTTLPWGVAKTWVLTLDGTTQILNAPSAGTTFWIQWDTTTMPNGSHTLMLTVTDATGRSVTATLPVNIVFGVAGMTASFTAPAPGASVSGTVTVGMAVSGASGTSNTFRLTLDGTPLSQTTVATTTASYAWNTVAAANGSHVLGLTATDSAGHTASASVTVNVANSTLTPLTASFTAPAALSTVSGTTSVQMAVTGASGSTNTFTLSVDGTIVFDQLVSAATASFPWDTTTVANGTHTLTLTVSDALLRTSTVTETVNVSNSTTTASFTASFLYPASGAIVIGSKSIGMSTTAPWGSPKTFTLAVDGKTITSQAFATGSTFWFIWNSTTTLNGAHTLTLTVTNGTNQSATATLPIVVSN